MLVLARFDINKCVSAQGAALGEEWIYFTRTQYKSELVNVLFSLRLTIRVAKGEMN